MIFQHDIAKRNSSLVVMRFLAAILITQSHLSCLLPAKYQALVVGADIGDGLFFFCAGFAVFLSRSANCFVDWFARKVVRIMPPFLAMGLMISLLFGGHPQFLDVITFKGYWFIQAIMIYYAVLYIVRKYFKNHLWIVFAVSYLLLMAYGLTFSYGPRYQLWGVFRFFSVFFLPVMLLGAVVGYEDANRTPLARFPWLWSLVAIVSVCIHYCVKISLSRGWYGNWTELQLLTMFVPMLLFYAIYRSLSAPCLNGWVLRHSLLYKFIYFVSSLTLEIYIVNSFVIDRTPGRFPYSIPLAYAAVLFAAFLLKVVTNLIVQFLRDHKFDWSRVIVVD